jgi:3-oxoacyl-(acyl-carrier-protein) synthase
MRRVVITGIGIVSCIGNNKDEVAKSLKNGTSGITKDERMAELGFRKSNIRSTNTCCKGSCTKKVIPLYE